MAISGTIARLLTSLKPVLPKGGTLLEIGEANWYGDVVPDFPCSNLDNSHAVAKDFYAELFAPSRILSIDDGGTDLALRKDLNRPLELDEQFDVSINHGTAEHIFNVAQVFRTMHDWTSTGGMMVHESPFTGWIDHGFYCLHPTLFYDLAAANCYEIVTIAIEEIKRQTIIRLDNRYHATELAAAGNLPNNSHLFVAFRKLVDKPFRIPRQGYYSRRLSDAGMKAWGELR